MALPYKKYIEIAIVALVAYYVVKHYLPGVAVTLGM